MSEKQVLSVLLTDETETLNRLVKKAERSLKINKKTGDTILLPPKTRLTDRQLIALYLLGRYFSSRLELTQTDTLSIEDLCKLSNLESNSVSARISDLKREGLIESAERGTYRVSYQSLESFGPILEEIEKISLATPISHVTTAGAVTSTSLENVDLGGRKDTDSIVLILYANEALPASDKWLAADEIINWGLAHGSSMRRETIIKYTLPQDPVLERLVAKRKIGLRRQYKLKREGFEHAKSLLKQDM